jgi:hypothetical protein
MITWTANPVLPCRGGTPPMLGVKDLGNRFLEPFSLLRSHPDSRRDG